MGKQKRITREELDAMVYGQMEARDGVRRERAAQYANRALQKIARGKFSIRESYYRYDLQPCIKLRLWFTQDYDIREFIQVLADAGYPDAETDLGDVPFSINVRIPIAKTGAQP